MGNHRAHLAYCGVVIAVAVMVVIMTGGAPASMALLAAALLCPLAMGVVVWLLLRPGERATRPTAEDAGVELRR
jgi:hypothetical protein